MIINAIAIANGGSGGSSKPPVVRQLDVTDNGTYTPSTGVDGFNPVNVNVQPPLQTKAVEITANGQSTIEADSEFYGLKTVNLNVDVPIPTFTTEELSVTANGTYTPSTDGYSKVEVNVPTPEPNLQAKSIEIVENGTQTISADEGYDGLSNVEVSTNVPTPEPNLQAKNRSLTITENGKMIFAVTPDSGYDGLSAARLTITTNVAASMPIVKFYNGETFKVGGSVDLSNWRADMSCTQLTNLFADNTELTSIDVSNIWDGYFNASPMVNTHDISGMFSGCLSLTTIKINNWSFESAEEPMNMSNLFNGCSRLETLEIKNFNEYAFPSIMTGMFSGCTALANIDFSGSSFLPTDMTWGLDYCPLSLASLVSLVDVLSDNSASGMTFSAGIGLANYKTLQKGNTEKFNEFIAKGWAP